MDRQWRNAMGMAFIVLIPVMLMIYGFGWVAQSIGEAEVTWLPSRSDGEAGYLSGFIHGCLIIVSFVAMWSDPDVALMQSHETPGSYEFGFLIGVCAFGYIPLRIFSLIAFHMIVDLVTLMIRPKPRSHDATEARTF